MGSLGVPPPLTYILSSYSIKTGSKDNKDCTCEFDNAGFADDHGDRRAQDGHSGPSGTGEKARAEITADTEVDWEEASRTYAMDDRFQPGVPPPTLGPFGEGGALCNRRSTAVPKGPPRHCPGDCDLQLHFGQHRWILAWGNLVHDCRILAWGNLVHDTTTTMPGPCSEKKASPQ
jgi:hypothetical protein